MWFAAVVPGFVLRNSRSRTREEPGKRLSLGTSYAASDRFVFRFWRPSNRATWVESSSLRCATSSRKRGHGGFRYLNGETWPASTRFRLVLMSRPRILQSAIVLEMG